MNKKRIMKKRLECILDDLTVSGVKANHLMVMIGESNDDKMKLLNDIYFSENAPIKRIREEFLPGVEGDTTEEMLELSMGFDTFVKSLGEAAKNEIEKHARALKLFSKVMELPVQLSGIIYLRYIKLLPIDEICKTLYICRSTYFRLQDQAIEILSNDEECGIPLVDSNALPQKKFQKTH